jgi:glucosamine-6-phosphate deaminase
MEIIIRPTSLEGSLLAARIVARTVREKPHAVLGFATGSTPLVLYQELARLHREKGLDFGSVAAFNLDEYIGLPVDHPASFHHYMRRNLFEHLNIRPEHVHIPDGLAADIPAACRKYEDEIRSAGGIDIQILGIGTNGHIGFNEPSSSLASRTRIKTLTRQTRLDNAADFGGVENVPPHVITMGLGTILESRMCLLLAFGAKKAEAVARMVEGPVTASLPASVLQLHPRSVIVLDREAAADLERAEYYEWTNSQKPEWQKY